MTARRTTRPAQTLATVLAGALCLGACTASTIPAQPGSASAGAGSGSPSGRGSSPASTTSSPGATSDAGLGVPAPSQAVRDRRTLFPGHRLVGFSGIAGHGRALGRLGVGDLDARVKDMTRVGKDYASDGRTVVPVAELIATVVLGSPGKDGKWRNRTSDEVVRRHLEAVRKVDGILLLAIQPGRSDFVTETRHYEKWLKEPDVGVALDPEWRMGPGEVPMKVFGSVTGKELDDTAAYLSGLVRDNDLPEKVMLYHQLSTRVVRRHEQLRPHPGVAQMVSVDGIGSKEMKLDTWRAVMRQRPAHVHPGFKLFYDEDSKGSWRVMTPAEVMAITPRPDYVLYE